MSAQPAATTDAKAALRQQVRARRRERVAHQDPADRHTDAVRLADAVLAGVRAHRQTSDSPVCRVAAYESRPAEPPTEVLIESLAAQGFEVVVPVTLSDRDLDWRIAASSGGERLGLDAVRTAAVLLVPGLAADRSGHRLGQGGGSYDRALPRRSADALVAVLLYDDELLEAGRVPADAHDVPVDAVVTPGGGWVSLNPAD